MRDYSFETTGRRLDESKHRDKLLDGISHLILARKVTAKQIQAEFPTLDKSAISNLRNGYMPSIGTPRLEALYSFLKSYNPSSCDPQSFPKAA